MLILHVYWSATFFLWKKNIRLDCSSICKHYLYQAWLLQIISRICFSYTTGRDSIAAWVQFMLLVRWTALNGYNEGSFFFYRRWYNFYWSWKQRYITQTQSKDYITLSSSIFCCRSIILAHSNINFSKRFDSLYQKSCKTMNFVITCIP